MKIIVISDSHRNIANIKHIMGFAKTIKAGGVIHCGDWDNVESAEEVLSFEIPLYAVIGNADIDDDIEEVLRFNAKGFDVDFLKFEIEGRKIGVIHNSKNLQLNPPAVDIVFSGDWHSKDETMINFVKFVRPGALSKGINFAVYETTNNTVEFFEDE